VSRSIPLDALFEPILKMMDDEADPEMVNRAINSVERFHVLLIALMVMKGVDQYHGDEEKMEKIHAYVQVCKDDFIKTLDQNIELNLAANDLLHHYRSEEKTHNQKVYEDIIKEFKL